MAFEIVVVAILAFAAALAVFKNKLTLAAGGLGLIISLFIFFSTGMAGISLIATFFILGTTATGWKASKKRELNIEEANSGKRQASQVWANAGCAFLIALAAIVQPSFANIALLYIAACFSSATADTLSSELGNIYGSKYYNILTFKRDTAGLDGVVSLEGTLSGIIGSAIISLVYSCYIGFDSRFFYIVIAGTAGNIVDSIFGATLERRGIIKNDSVNFFNTLVAAAVMAILYS
jgi:uncharacterized protein (TIGR00297 family)